MKLSEVLVKPILTEKANAQQDKLRRYAFRVNRKANKLEIKKAVDKSVTQLNDAWDKAVAQWRNLISDPGAHFDRSIAIDASTLAPFVTWGTNPGMVVPYPGR